MGNIRALNIPPLVVRMTDITIGPVSRFIIYAVLLTTHNLLAGVDTRIMTPIIHPP
jgi:hypothetical protein